jgi:hypothetical protein
MCKAKFTAITHKGKEYKIEREQDTLQQIGQTARLLQENEELDRRINGLDDRIRRLVAQIDQDILVFEVMMRNGNDLRADEA